MKCYAIHEGYADNGHQKHRLIVLNLQLHAAKIRLPFDWEDVAEIVEAFNKAIDNLLEICRFYLLYRGYNDFFSRRYDEAYENEVIRSYCDFSRIDASLV